MLARLAFGNVRKSLRDFGVYFLTVVLAWRCSTRSIP